MNQVLFVDNNPVFRLGLRGLVRETHPDLEIREAENFAAARDVLRANSNVVLTILDIKVPGSGGFVGLFQLRKEFPDVPIIVCSDNSDAETISRAVAFGAAGYISRSAPCDVITRTLKGALSERAWSPVPIGAGGNQVNPIAALSPAQLRVLKGLKRGLRNKQIAFELGLTEKTVKAYMSTLYRRLGVNSRTQALLLLQEVALEPQLAETLG